MEDSTTVLSIGDVTYGMEYRFWWWKPYRNASSSAYRKTAHCSIMWWRRK